MIDTHVHLWRLGQNGCTWPTPDLAPIHRDFTLNDLREVTRAAGVDRVVLVQSQEADIDTAWILSIAGDPLIAGVVGWVDFFRADAPAASTTYLSAALGKPAACLIRLKRSSSAAATSRPSTKAAALASP